MDENHNAIKKIKSFWVVAGLLLAASLIGAGKTVISAATASACYLFPTYCGTFTANLSNGPSDQEEAREFVQFLIDRDQSDVELDVYILHSARREQEDCHISTLDEDSTYFCLADEAISIQGKEPEFIGAASFVGSTYRITGHYGINYTFWHGIGMVIELKAR